MALERLSMALRGDLARRGREHDLSPLQAQVLSNLFALPDPPGVRDLARLLGLSPGTVSETVSSLEGRGLLQKVPHPGNRRKILIRLTFDPSRRYCTFLNESLRPEDLRVDCPDHRLKEAHTQA